MISGRPEVKPAAANVKMKREQTQRGVEDNGAVCLSSTCKFFLHPFFPSEPPSIDELCSQSPRPEVWGCVCCGCEGGPVTGAEKPCLFSFPGCGHQSY